MDVSDKNQQQSQEDTPMRHAGVHPPHPVSALIAGKLVEVPAAIEDDNGTFTLVKPKDKKIIQDKQKPNNNMKKKAQHSKVAPMRMTNNGKDMAILNVRTAQAEGGDKPMKPMHRPEPYAHFQMFPSILRWSDWCTWCGRMMARDEQTGKDYCPTCCADEIKGTSTTTKDEIAAQEIPKAPEDATATAEERFGRVQPMAKHKKNNGSNKKKVQFGPGTCIGACCNEDRGRGDTSGICIPDANSVDAWDGMGSDREKGHRKLIMGYEHIGQHESDPRTEEPVPFKAATAQRTPIDAPGCVRDVDDGTSKQKAMENHERFYGLPSGSCTLDQVVDSSVRLEGWLEFTGPGIHYEPSPRSNTHDPSRRSRRRRCSEKPGGSSIS